MTGTTLFDAARTIEAAMKKAVAILMLHPETFAESVAAGNNNPFSRYLAGCGGVLGDATATAVSSVFVVFEPGFPGAPWHERVAVRGAADLYREQAANFARRHLSGLRVWSGSPRWGRNSSRWRRMRDCPLMRAGAKFRWLMTLPRGPCRVMFVLREMCAGVHFSAFTISGIAPVEAHMPNKGRKYTTMFGWPEPFADGEGQKCRYAESEKETNRRLAQIFAAALQPAEAIELSMDSVGALTTLKTNLAK